MVDGVYADNRVKCVVREGQGLTGIDLSKGYASSMANLLSLTLSRTHGILMKIDSIDSTTGELLRPQRGSSGTAG